MFLIQKIASKDASSISYLYGCGGKGYAVAVDVHQDDVEWFLQRSMEKECKIKYIIDTHIHADHISGGRKLAKLSGGQYMLHKSSQLNFNFDKLKDNQVLLSGNVSTKIIHTPGHTTESICLLVNDNRRAEVPWFLITGHTLFVNSAGRPDLKGSEKKMAGLLYDSIFDKILTLPEYIEIYPGAMAGSVCGAGLSAKSSSTLGYESKFNTSLNLNKTDFIKRILASIPEKPKNMQEIISQNIT